MGSLFWRNRLKRAARGIEKSFPALPSDVDDNIYLMQAAQAASADKESNAYDEFLFSEDGFEIMPFEDSSDEFVQLQVQANSERQSRATLPLNLRIGYLEGVVKSLQAKKVDISGDLERIEVSLELERDILAGNTPGKSGGNWAGSVPDTTSMWRHVTRQWFKWLIFLGVAAVDALVIYLSLRLITPTELEAIQLTFPTAAVQVLFPHLVGHAMGLWLSRGPHRGKYLAQALLIGLAWAIYLYAMTELRYNLIAKSYFDRWQTPLEGPLSIALRVFSLLVLVGLGAWLMFNELNTNPHEAKFSRLRFAQLRLSRRLRKAEEKLERATADLDREHKLMDAVISNWDLRVNRFEKLRDASKSTYRRALVNKTGETDFTTSYLPKEKFKIRLPRRNRDV